MKNKPGDNIKFMRERMKLNQADLAEYLGIKREEVSYYENGKRRLPNALLTKLANLFSVDEYDLLTEDMTYFKINSALAFRTENFETDDLSSIADFKKIAMNYLKMNQKLKNE